MGTNQRYLKRLVLVGAVLISGCFVSGCSDNTNADPVVPKPDAAAAGSAGSGGTGGTGGAAGEGGGDTDASASTGGAAGTSEPDAGMPDSVVVDTGSALVCAASGSFDNSKLKDFLLPDGGLPPL